MTPIQLEMIKKDCRELTHYIKKLHKRGKDDLAHKLEVKLDYMESMVTEIRYQDVA